MIRFCHNNFNVFDIEKSLKFYDEALGLKPVREKMAGDGSGKLTFLGDGITGFTLELTSLFDREEPYHTGDNEAHLAFVTDAFDALHEKHKKMGIITRESEIMGLYFISDPDGNLIEILPVR